MARPRDCPRISRFNLYPFCERPSVIPTQGALVLWANIKINKKNSEYTLLGFFRFYWIDISQTPWIKVSLRAFTFHTSYMKSISRNI